MGLILLLLLASSFTVFAERSVTSPHTPPPHSHSPTQAPLHAPAYAPHPHHHRHHPPTPAPVMPPTHHHHPPTSAPTKPPTHHHHPPAPAPAPTKPPTHHHHPPAPAPAKPPVHTPVPHFRIIVVQGVVYVKSCKYPGVDTLLGASPVSEAVVKLKCNSTKDQTAKTDKNGYFFIEAAKSTSPFAAHNCRMFLVSEPSHRLKRTNMNNGVAGATLRPEKPSKNRPFRLYSVGPFAFEPPTGCRP